MDQPAADVFAQLYSRHFDAVLGYALRRVPVVADAGDIVAETFLVAWRRLDDAPPAEEARSWLYAVARGVLANHRRGEVRRTQLGARLRDQLAVAVPDFADRVARTVDTEALLARLPAKDREVVELAAWEELEPREIAQVMGISAIAARTRLSRARARLREYDRNDPVPAGQSPRQQSPLAPEEGR